MEIQTRRHILELWRATVDYCYRDGDWIWGGGLNGRNSISDTEQLLTILYPATAIGSLNFGSVDETTDDVLEYLRSLGNAVDIPNRLVSIIDDYMRTYTNDGTPDFSGGTYLEPRKPEEATAVQPAQMKLEVVDSYSMSVTLCLATLGFLRTYRRSLRSQRMLEKVDELERLSSRRLTAAMVGLLRSFTVNTFDPSDPPGEMMCKMINQTGAATEVLVRDLLAQLADVRAGLRQELATTSGDVADELENQGRLFECGWSWGVIDGAAELSVASDIGKQSTGVAEARPYLYFTVVAFDGIADLFTEQTRVLGLLDEEQQRLARLLQLRWELTRQFWGTIATFGEGRWPLEDLPWMITDGTFSDYYTLLLTSIVIEGAGTDRLGRVEPERIGRLLEELSNTGRITRRPTKDDTALARHMPGRPLWLVGSDKVPEAEGPLLQWMVSSYSSLLLKRLLRVAQLLDDSAARLHFLDLADHIWAHIERRRIETGQGRGLWDQPTQVFTDTSYPPYEKPSWYQTERVMEALVASAAVTQSRAAVTPEQLKFAEQLLAEAEHLFDRERLRGTNDTGVRLRESFQVVGAKLRRARDLINERPGTASILIGDVLRELDAVDAARQDTARMS
jgi:hypothetical protein